MEVIMSYDDIMEYINKGYEPLQDLQLTLKHNLLDNNKNYRVWLKGKHIDVYGSFIEKHIPTHIAFGKIIWGHDVCYSINKDYIVDK